MKKKFKNLDWGTIFSSGDGVYIKIRQLKGWDAWDTVAIMANKGFEEDVFPGNPSRYNPELEVRIITPPRRERGRG